MASFLFVLLSYLTGLTVKYATAHNFEHNAFGLCSRVSSPQHLWTSSWISKAHPVKCCKARNSETWFYNGGRRMLKATETIQYLTDKMRVSDSEVENSQDCLNTRIYTHIHTGKNKDTCTRSGCHHVFMSAKTDCKSLGSIQKVCVHACMCMCNPPRENDKWWNRKKYEKGESEMISVCMKSWDMRMVIFLLKNKIR